jgi:hypothetical protein
MRHSVRQAQEPDFPKGHGKSDIMNLWMATLRSYQGNVDQIRSCPAAATPSSRNYINDRYTFGTTRFMRRMTIARHGGTAPQSAPRQIASSAILPGRTGVTFYDAHVSVVKLNDLWTLNWQRNCGTPAMVSNPAR